VDYTVAGDGPAIICSELPLNPFAFFGAYQQRLSQSYRVFILDFRPAIGGSARQPPATDLLRFIADLSVETLERLGFLQSTLVGSFMYGAVAMDIAANAGTRVQNLILMNPLGLVSGPQSWLLRAITSFYRLPGIPVLMRWRTFRWLVESVDRNITGPLRMRQIFEKPVPTVKLEDLYEQYRAPRNAAAALTLMWAIRHMSYEGMRALAAKIKAPTLIIHGENDCWIPVRYAEALSSLIPTSRLVVIPGTRHVPQIEAAEAVCEQTRSFLEGSR
jgi:pimeloyl-ACP methyl ester carboxylesterase